MKELSNEFDELYTAKFQRKKTKKMKKKIYEKKIVKLYKTMLPYIIFYRNY